MLFLFVSHIVDNKFYARICMFIVIECLMVVMECASLLKFHLNFST